MSATLSYREFGGEIPRTVAFVILTWNSEGYVRACLESVLGLGDMCAAAYVVDNGSTDGTLDALSEIAAADGRLRMLPQGCNLGTTVSRNIAIREALTMSPRPGYICVLDSDTVANEAAIGSAVDALESDPTIAVAGPTLVGGGMALSSSRGAISPRSELSSARRAPSGAWPNAPPRQRCRTRPSLVACRTWAISSPLAGSHRCGFGSGWAFSTRRSSMPPRTWTGVSAAMKRTTAS